MPRPTLTDGHARNLGSASGGECSGPSVAALGRPEAAQRNGMRVLLARFWGDRVCHGVSTIARARRYVNTGASEVRLDGMKPGVERQ